MSNFDVTKQKVLDLIRQNANKSLVSTSKTHYKELKFGRKKRITFSLLIILWSKEEF